ncbi:hypothetical protein EIP86_002899 [Pleurotus ostreatoroseus]|nr:hypothetical protein EIP86_002899 [Pleurotus ostreatoroseus]
MRSVLGFALSLQALLHPGIWTKKPRCKCLSTEPCWPSAHEFSELQSQLSQPLLKPIPPASPCYTSGPTSADCLAVQNSWDNATWRSDQPGSMQSPNFDNYIFKNGTINACYLNTSLGVRCEQGSVPVLGVDTRWPEDVEAAVKFASTHNLRVVVKNTGHDYLGRSTARGSFLIWTHNMKNISFHDTFTPVSGPASVIYNDVVTLGGGVQWNEAYAAVNSRGRDIVGGVSTAGSVGSAGGWFQGGGHSALSPKYGLGVDNAIQLTVVTADGVHRTANTYRNPDLFWALRGGGGGTFGVVTSVTYKTYPSTPIIVSNFSAYINTTVSNATASPVLQELFTEFVRMTPAMSDGGWAGYATIAPMAPTFANSLAFTYLAPNLSWEAANATMNPFFDFARALAANSSVETTGKLNIVAASTIPMDSFATLYERDLAKATGPAGTSELTSRLIAGGAVAKPDPNSTGLNPAWRKALVLYILWTAWDEGASSSVIEQQRDTLKRYTSVLNDLVPHAGTYLNEASLHELDSPSTFFGSHYARLRSIKAKYDPADLFIVASGVGSEDWDIDLNCHI